MNAFSGTQTSGNNWVPPTNLRAYHAGQQPETIHGAGSSTTIASLERQMAHFEAEHRKVVNELAKHYVMPADSSVSTFLRSHRTVPALLIEAVPQLRKYFGREAIIALSSCTDESGYEALYAIVYWTGPIADARAALMRFDEDWWLSRVGQASGYLTFTYELR